MREIQPIKKKVKKEVDLLLETLKPDNFILEGIFSAIILFISLFLLKRSGIMNNDGSGPYITCYHKSFWVLVAIVVFLGIITATLLIYRNTFGVSWIYDFLSRYMEEV